MCREALGEIKYDTYSGKHSTNVVTTDYKTTPARTIEIRDFAREAAWVVRYKVTEPHVSPLMATRVIEFKKNLKLFWENREELPTTEFF